jgi:prepilin-type N-terminal cleavage/methylation domain-containing protein
MHFPPKYLRTNGFTLVELLVVIAIMAILAYLTIPAFSSLSRAQAINQGIYDISSILQLGRSEAVARQTYVWVGFYQSTSANNQPEVTIVATSSLDGSTNMAAANLRNLTRPVQITGVSLTPWTGLNTKTQTVFTNTTPGNVAPASVVGSNASGMTFPTYTTDFTNTVTFTPRGEAMLNRTPTSDTPYDPYIDVSFKQPTQSNNDASVVIEGGTGMVQTVRVQ